MQGTDRNSAYIKLHIQETWPSTDPTGQPRNTQFQPFLKNTKRANGKKKIWILNCRQARTINQNKTLVIWNTMRPNKQWEVIALEQLVSHIERRPTTTETRVAYNNSCTWHAINTRYTNSTKETLLRFLLSWACILCDVNCSSTITSHCLLNIKLLYSNKSMDNT